MKALAEKNEATAATRKASPEDAEGIKKLVDKFQFRENGDGELIHLSSSDISHLITSSSFYVVETGGNVVACGSVVEYDGIAELRSLAVDYSHQRNGLGTAIIGKCIEEAKTRGHKMMYTLTQPQNIALFEKAGFKMTETPPEKLSRDCEICPIYGSCNESALAIKL